MFIWVSFTILNGIHFLLLVTYWNGHFYFLEKDGLFGIDLQNISLK